MYLTTFYCSHRCCNSLTSQETEPQSLNQGHRSRPNSSIISLFPFLFLSPSGTLITHMLELFCSPHHSMTPSHLFVSVGCILNNLLEPNNLIL